MTRGAAALLFLSVAGGCAPHPPPSRVIPTTWSTVTTLAPGTEVRLELDGDYHERLTDVR